MNVPQPQDLEGASLGKYQVLKKIGSGNMATVYMGHDPFIDRPGSDQSGTPRLRLQCRQRGIL